RHRVSADKTRPHFFLRTESHSGAIVEQAQVNRSDENTGAHPPQPDDPATFESDAVEDRHRCGYTGSSAPRRPGAHTVLTRAARSTDEPIISAARSMSSPVVQRPNDSRNADEARRPESPIAVSTAEGCAWPLWHAEPVEAASPGISASRSFPRTPSMLTFTVFGSLERSGPLSITRSPSASRRRSCSRSRYRRRRSGRPASRADASRRADVPNGTVKTTFYVPARSPCSCPLPWIRGTSDTPVRTYNAPMPFGAYIL